MTRILVFSGPRAPKRFELLWAALHISDDKAERNPTIIRKEARLQDILEKASIPANGGDPILSRELKGEPTLTLTQEDFDFLQKATEQVKWTPMASKDVVDLWDWLSVAEKND
jgi:hypothetical protein